MHYALKRAQPNYALCIKNYALNKAQPNYALCIKNYALNKAQPNYALCIMNYALNYGVFVDEVVEEGVDGEAGDALDTSLAHNVLAVGGDGEHAHVEACGNLLV